MLHFNSDPASLRGIIQQLCDAELFDSAALIASIVVNLLRKGLSNRTRNIDDNYMGCLVLFGDALYGQRNYRRAAAEHHLEHYEATSKNKADCLELQATLLLKQARCHAKLNEPSQAIAHLEKISPKKRSYAINTLLGQLYIQTGRKKRAAASLSDAVRSNGFCIENVIPLLRLGLGEKDILDMLGETLTKCDPELKSILILNTSASASEIYGHTKAAIETLVQLEGALPSHAETLARLGHLYKRAGKYNESFVMLGKARENDPFILDHMDDYIVVSRSQYSRRKPELYRAVQELLTIDDSRPQPWLAAAMLSQQEGDGERALVLSQKALRVDKLYSPGYAIRGKILHALGKLDQAAASFQQAKRLSREDFGSYRGLVMVYLDMPKYAEALTIAKEALERFPRDPQAIVLVGQVLSRAPEGHEKAKRAFARALSVDPGNVDASLALAHIYCGEGAAQSAIQILRKVADHCTDNSDVFAKLGYAESLDMQYESALLSYHKALSIHPEHPEALVGVEKLEKALKGLEQAADHSSGSLDDNMEEIVSD